jgi:hypothetical protein
MAKFKETQYFRQWWIWLFLIALVLFTIYGLYTQLYLGIPFGNNPASDEGFVLIACFIGLFILFFATCHLNTEIDERSIRFRFFPFVNKEIAWDDVLNCKIINYGFVGGWGIRLWTKYGTVYNVKGKIGLLLELKSGKKMLIGTQRSEELAEFLKSQKQFLN